ncbi:MAG: pirin family protein [Deltaproteobacteria bacterium]|nr:pirin family protein [Deltaproteobacteria bacterium]
MHIHRPSQERGHLNFGWLDTYHSFSFGDYHDPQWVHFRSLRVINEDYIEPNQGFPTHSHQDMEIITYVLEGELSHKDSMGNGSKIPAGEFQYMSAGTGVTHSEYSHPKSKTHLLQIWIFPDQKDYTPRYQQCQIDSAEKLNQLCQVIGPDGSGKPIEIHQDTKLFNSVLEEGKNLTYPIQKDRHLWLQLIRGELACGETQLKAGDGLGLSEEEKLEVKSLKGEAEFLLFDLS